MALRTAAAQPTAAWVEQPVQVTLMQDACNSYDAQELASILEVELRAIGVQSLVTGTLPRGAKPGLALIRLSCDVSGTELNVEVTDVATGNQLKRQLPFAALAPEARPRALALAIAVLVETSWFEVATRPARSPGASALPREVKAALRKRLALSFNDDEPALAPQPTAANVSQYDNVFGVLIEGRSYPAHATGLLGLQLAYLPRLGALRLWLSADAALGKVTFPAASSPIADVRLYWLSGGIGVSWVSDTLPELGLGPYARFGYAMVQVELDPSAASYPAPDGSSFVATIGVQALLRAPLNERTYALLGCDLGYAVGGVLFVADGRSWASLADISLGLRLGLAR